MCARQVIGLLFRRRKTISQRNMGDQYEQIGPVGEAPPPPDAPPPPPGESEKKGSQEKPKAKESKEKEKTEKEKLTPDSKESAEKLKKSEDLTASTSSVEKLKPEKKKKKKKKEMIRSAEGETEDLPKRKFFTTNCVLCMVATFCFLVFLFIGTLAALHFGGVINLTPVINRSLS
ncbi:hypothetical protein Q1695_005536 [Nippostrongylus brasiliensis]|nr:hypothetical protein Q1695_005536 [Nippostrongylus brasiliensis]